MAICTNCGSEIKDGATFCPQCGKVLLQKEKTAICPVCGSENDVNALYCAVCGAEMPAEKNENFESESVSKLKDLIPKIKAISATFGDPYAGASEEEIEAMTYVCPVCGKRNSLNSQKCERCGRDRKRSAALLAKNKFKKISGEVPDRKFRPELEIAQPAEEAAEEAVTAEEAVYAPSEEEIAEQVTADAVEEAAEAPAEEEIVAEEAAEEETLSAAEEENTEAQPQEEPAAQGANPYYYPYGYPYPPQDGAFAQPYAYPFGGQLPPIIQPIAFVPYVSQDQPLWQAASADEVAGITLKNLGNSQNK